LIFLWCTEKNKKEYIYNVKLISNINNIKLLTNKTVSLCNIKF
jgi:hypothetical protein